ncbi:MAG: stage V sporulation protein AB [Clostridiales bacterium]|nr:stage V sporulation protein AB [Clostridiales bacterium]
MNILKGIVLILIGLGSGLFAAGAVVAFIAIIGVVPRLAQKTDTKEYIKLYEEAIIAGGIIGGCDPYFDFYMPLNGLAVIFLSLCIGIFYGSLAVSLAEVLNIIPILTRRVRLQQGMRWFVCAIALGKLTGSLLYYFVPGFYYM